MVAEVDAKAGGVPLCQSCSRYSERSSEQGRLHVDPRPIVASLRCRFNGRFRLCHDVDEVEDGSNRKRLVSQASAKANAKVCQNLADG